MTSLQTIKIKEEKQRLLTLISPTRRSISYYKIESNIMKLKTNKVGLAPWPSRS